jgi:uncharacterized protein
MSSSDRDPTFPNALEAIFLVVVLFGVEYVLSAALYDAHHAWHLDPRSAGAVIGVLSNGVLFTALLYYKRLSYRQLFHPGSQSVVATIATLALPVLLLVPALDLAMEQIDRVLIWLFPLSSAQEAAFEAMVASSLAPLISACILAPVLEEMLFRGIMLRSFLQQYTRRRAIVFSAIIFGMAHLNIYQFAVATLLGLLLGWLYERSRSLWPCILLHAAYNAAVAWASAQDDGLSGGALGPVPTWLLSLAGAFAGMLLLRKLLGSRATG